MSKPMIEVRNFRCGLAGHSGTGRGRGESVLLDGIQFTVEAGERLALIGANGVGKTTLLCCLDLIRTDWEGEILLEGRSVRQIPRKELARHVAFIQQTPDFSFDQTVRDFVATGRYPHLNPFTPFSERDEAILLDAMTRTRIRDLADRPLSALSGGERQRVFLAAALAQEPTVLLLDEPSAFLDYRHQAELNRLLDDIRRRNGTTLIEVTHDLNRAVLADAHVVALADGGVLYDGPASGMMNPETLYRLYRTDLQLVDHPTCHKRMVLPTV